jgi:hypothetical protein
MIRWTDTSVPRLIFLVAGTGRGRCICAEHRHRLFSKIYSRDEQSVRHTGETNCIKPVSLNWKLTENYSFIERCRYFKLKVTHSDMKRFHRNCCNKKLSRTFSHNFSFVENIAVLYGDFRYSQEWTKKVSRTVLIPNVVVEWLPILLRIWEVPGSNLGLETGYPD